MFSLFDMGDVVQYQELWQLSETKKYVPCLERLRSPSAQREDDLLGYPHHNASAIIQRCPGKRHSENSKEENQRHRKSE